MSPWPRKRRRARQSSNGSTGWRSGSQRSVLTNVLFVGTLRLRQKDAFLSDQCKEIEENNTMGKTRDLFKKTRDTKGTFHAKMGLIKDRNGLDLTEAEDIKKRR